jgi:hypothetical protein
MTIQSETAAPRKRGRPFSVLGPKRRQQQLTEHFIKELGGESAITPVLEMNIARAVALTCGLRHGPKPWSGHN